MDVMIGHNAPPNAIDELRGRLAVEAAPLIKRRDELLTGVERAPVEVGDDDIAGKTGDLVKLLTTCIKAAEVQRIGTKEPFLESGRAVDGFYKKITDPLAGGKALLQGRLDAYLTRKAAEARRRAEEEAKQARLEAERLAIEAAAREAAAKPADALLDQAVAKEAEAIAAAQDAAARPAEHSRTRGDYGSVASLRTTWTGEVIDYAALELETLRPHIARDALDAALRSFVRAGGRTLAGAKIYEKSSAVVR